jgi:hypothetical protein
MSLYNTFLKWEKYFFFFIVLVHLIPILSLDFFVTLDGPARVYHSSLIVRLLSGNTLASDYMVLNTEPVPYWTAQLILSITNQFFSGNISEKILIGIYVLALPLTFRKFILTVSSQASWISYLIFPFIYSFLLYVGFYNFCLGLPVLFFTLHVFLSPNLLENKKKLILTFLILLLYFSHLFVWVIFFLFAGIFLIVDAFYLQVDTTQKIKWLLKKISNLLLVSIPTLLLSLHFILINLDKQFFNSSIPFSELLRWLVIAHPIITFKTEGEEPYAIIIAITMFFLTINLLYSIGVKKYSSKGNVWVIFCFLLLLLYFSLPNNLSTGGFVSMRLLLLFYIFLIVWFTAGHFHRIAKGLSVIIFLSISIYFLKYHSDEGKFLSENAKEYYSLTTHIKENSILLPLDYSDNWMHNNIAAYLGTTRNIFLMDDYDASSPHFPVIWKYHPAPPEILGEYFGSVPPCLNIDNFEKISGHNLDYITRWKYNLDIQDSCTLAINRKLEKSFERIFVSSSGSAELFKRK